MHLAFKRREGARPMFRALSGANGGDRKGQKFFTGNGEETRRPGAVNFLAAGDRSLPQLYGNQLPRILRASSRISSRSILNFNVLSGMPSARAVPVTFHPDFSSARMRKLRSKVVTARSRRFPVEGPSASS